MEQIKKESFSNFTKSTNIEDYHPSTIMETIRKSHDAGFESADKMWRKAILEFFKINGIKQVTFTQLFTIIQNQNQKDLNNLKKINKMIREED